MKPLAKRIVAGALCLCLAMSLLPLPALAEDPADTAQDTAGSAARETFHISTADDLLQLADACRLDSWSQNRVVVLDADIDLTGVEFSGIPTFGGTLEGQDHTISGLSITGSGSVQGLFRYIQQGAVVRQLHVSGTVSPAGTRATVGGIAGQNAGTIENCSFDGTVTGTTQIGGIAGINTVTGILTGCSVSGRNFGINSLPTSKNRPAAFFREILVARTVAMLEISWVRMTAYSSPKGFSSETTLRRLSSSASPSWSHALELMKE